MPATRKDLTAPQVGDNITITGVVLTSHTHADNKFYGTGFAQLRVKIDQGRKGYGYADLRLVVDDTPASGSARRRAPRPSTSRRRPRPR